MAPSFLTTVFLPLALFLVMLGIGLGLRWQDFGRVWTEPKAVFIGLVAQIVMVPVVGFGVVLLGRGLGLPLTPELAVGLMIVAACPGGPTSNLVTYLARGNVALSITLTAVSSLVAVFTIPLVINLATETFLGEATSLQLPFVRTVVQLAVITLIPVTLGMALRRFAPAWGGKVEQGVKWLSLGFLALIILGLLVRERGNVLGFLVQVGWATLGLNLATMAIGYLIATLTQLDRRDTTAITVEVGIQNGTLALTIALTLLNQPTLAIPAAIYSLLMYVTGGLFGIWVTQQQPKLAVPSDQKLLP